MIKRNAAKPVRVAPLMMEEQEVSTSTLQELLEKEETVSNLIFSKGREEGISKSYKSFKNCTFRNQTFSECKFRSSQLEIYGSRTATCPIYLLQKAPFTE